MVNLSISELLFSQMPQDVFTGKEGVSTKRHNESKLSFLQCISLEYCSDFKNSGVLLKNPRALVQKNIESVYTVSFVLFLTNKKLFCALCKMKPLKKN